MRFLMSFMRWKLIAGAALIAAVVIGCNFAIRWSNARLIQKNQEWNARIDRAGLRDATPQQVMAYLRHEHLPFAVYHDDLSIIIVKAESDNYFSLSDGFSKRGNKVWISFHDGSPRLECDVIPTGKNAVWTKQSPGEIPAGAKRFLR